MQIKLVNLHHQPYFLICFSMSGHRVVPSADIHFYSATKYAVTALTEGLRQELREANTHIRVTVRFYPGWAFIAGFDKDLPLIYQCSVKRSRN